MQIKQIIFLIIYTNLFSVLIICTSIQRFANEMPIFVIARKNCFLTISQVVSNWILSASQTKLATAMDFCFRWKSLRSSSTPTITFRYLSVNCKVSCLVNSKLARLRCLEHQILFQKSSPPASVILRLPCQPLGSLSPEALRTLLIAMLFTKIEIMSFRLVQVVFDKQFEQPCFSTLSRLIKWFIFVCEDFTFRSSASKSFVRLCELSNAEHTWETESKNVKRCRYKKVKQKKAIQ